MKNTILGLVILACLGVGCKDKTEERDASGMFETREVIVSSEMSGRVERLEVMEGDYIEAGKVVGLIDTMQLHWLKVQAQQAVKAVDERIPNLDKVLEVYRLKVEKGEKELKRVERLLEGKAATRKQYDDVKAMVDEGRSALAGQTHQAEVMIAGAKAESAAIALKVDQVNDQIRRCLIVNPIEGTVLAKYTEEKELAAPVKALYKIGDLKNMTLQVYLEGGRIGGLKVGDPVRVFAKLGGGEEREYRGKISWIASEAEFVPKTVQTQDERDNLVYAVKIHVENDGFLRVGMYADVKFNTL
ncbi:MULTISPECIES: HlyD family secretion protein [Butyricimonas]|uniref:HlyD family secretion protein n=1 Tax=Butyricimonas TaxID=574697 RepID=UPI001D0729CE|nr:MULTISPECIES: HlyD family efflux transporter periplasmic adaptor subunit [Butyricimonas]MCB6974579.1 HlyD family efflux transporter periplasmic adaptor subunit [Butyricimonas synergistica]MCG4518299.1 HlyD family efflux transporter periplasmic adaptor subunit [Butyricimonas sp. DFI.6.44]